MREEDKEDGVRRKQKKKKNPESEKKSFIES